MIHLTRLSHQPLVLNADLIESIEATPDTVIGLTNGQKLMVLEAPAEIVRRVVAFRRAIHSGISGILQPYAADAPSVAPGASTDGGEDRIENGTVNRNGS